MVDFSSVDRHCPKTDGEAPCPRDQCSAAVCGRKLALFGGRTYGARLNDLHVFDLDTFAWSACPSAGTVPPPRQGAASCADAEGQLWIHGGAGRGVSLRGSLRVSSERQERNRDKKCDDLLMTAAVRSTSDSSDP